MKFNEREREGKKGGGEVAFLVLIIYLCFCQKKRESIKMS